jgi:hypothetical protein
MMKGGLDMNPYLKTLYVAIGIGVIVGITGLVIGFQHNPQGEFVDLETGAIDVGYASLVFMSWFSLSTLVAVAIGSMLTLLFNFFGRR